MYGDEKGEFDDGAYRVHEHCLTKEEKKKFDEVYADEQFEISEHINLADDPRFKHLQG